MKLPDHNIVDAFREIINIVTSREKLKQFLTTPLYSNAFYLILNYAVMSFLGFFFWMVVARFYTEFEVGFSAAIISAISLLAAISVFGLNSSLIRFLPQTSKSGEFINSCFTMGSLISLVVAGVFLAGLEIWSPSLSFIKENVIFTLAFIAFTLAWTLSSLVDATFIARRGARFVLYKNTIFSLVKIPLPVILILFFHTFGIVASWGVAISIALAVSFFLFLRRVQKSYRPVPSLNLNLIKRMGQYSGGNYLANLLLQAPVWILPLVVLNLMGAKQNAYFYVTWMIAGLLFAIPGGVASSLFVEGSHFKERLKENVIKSLKFTFLLLIPAVVLLVLVGKWLLLAFGQSYSDNAWQLLQILVISGLPIGIIRIYISVLRVTHRLRELIVIEGLMAVIILVGSFLIIPSTGIIGIGYVFVGVQTVVAIYILSARRLI